MARKVRLLARYPADFPVEVWGSAWREPTLLQAKDISKGGVFLRTSSSPEIFSELKLRIILPWGETLPLAGRIVHLVGPQRAAAQGGDAGVGVEFLNLAVAERVVLERLVTWARASDPGRCVPKRSEQQLPADLNTMLAYALAAVDGQRSIDEIADHLQVDATAVESLLIQLAGLGLVSLGESTKVTQLSLRAGTNVATLRSMPPPEGSESLTPEEERLIDELWARDSEDHYAMLQLSRSASREQVREAYFGYARRWNPDRLAARQLGAHAQKVQELFERMTEAYAVLSSHVARKQYDEYLEREKIVGRPVELLTKEVTVEVPVSSAAHSRPATRPINGGPEQSAAKQGAAAPGSVDLVRLYLAQATKASDRGDMPAAARALALLEALEWDRPDLRVLYEQLDAKVCVAMVGVYEQQARCETNRQSWKKAARYWQRVCRARPNDVEAHRMAAQAILATKQDLRRARDLAARAVELSPNDVASRRTLGHVYLEAGFHHNARRELEVAASLNRHDPETVALLSRVERARPVKPGQPEQRV